MEWVVLRVYNIDVGALFFVVNSPCVYACACACVYVFFFFCRLSLPRRAKKIAAVSGPCNV